MKSLFAALTAFIAACVCAAPAAAAPRLVILVVVDGLGYDTFDRYRGAYTGGFQTLMQEGFEFTQAFHDHGVTTSAPGHATLATGAPPSAHGVVDNTWTEFAQGSMSRVASPTDPAHPVLNHRSFLAQVEASISPTRRRVASLADWAARTGGRALAIGQGSTSAMAMAPLANGVAYWTSGVAGGFVTSSYFVDHYPRWVLDFNRSYRARALAERAWTFTAPLSVAPADDGVGGRDPAFPHAISPQAGSAVARRQAHIDWFRGTPMHDEVLLDFARAAIREERFGRDGAVDALLINVSSIDEASHEFGPSSRENWDALYRLDRALNAFIAFLDRELGRDNYTLALSADHGAAEPAENVQGGIRVGVTEIQSTIAAIDAMVEGRERGEARALAAAHLRAKPYVADVYFTDETHAPSGFYERLYARSLTDERIPDLPFSSQGRSLARHGLIVRLREGATFDFATSIHVSPYARERHVPLFFLGRGVRAGQSAAPVTTVSVAPSLAAAADIPTPESAEGVSVLDLMQ